MRWEKHGDVWLMFDGLGWKRAIIMWERSFYLGIGIFGSGGGLREISKMTNRRELQRELQRRYLEVYPK